MDRTREQHPEFYFKDGTVTFLIQEQTREILYRLYPGLLVLRSSVLESMLSLPQQGHQQNAEGSCDENPIVLRGIVQHDFDHFLTFLTGGYVGEEKWEDFLVSVLKTSAFLEIECGFKYAVNQLDCLSSIDPFLKLELGRKYHVDHWVELAFRQLMARPLSSISRLEAYRLGIEYFYILATTKAAIEDHYRAIALTEPSFTQSPDCKTPLQCSFTWKDEWWNGVARHLLYPELPCRGDELLRLLEEADIQDICTACKDATLSHLKNSDALQYEKTLRDIAVAQIMDLQTAEHIRASFRDL